jgi:hypothetical protein
MSFPADDIDAVASENTSTYLYLRQLYAIYGQPLGGLGDKGSQ